MIEKKALRDQYREIRRSISQKRREEAAHLLLVQLEEKLAAASRVLSFMSMKDEIDSSHVNSWLLTFDKLYLPKIVGDGLKIYKIQDLDRDLVRSGFGLLEPIPELCQDIESVDIALVPGLLFDQMHHRLGYGRGHYDFFLKAHPDLYTIGIGFKEQYYPHSFNPESHDIAMDALCLV